MVWLDTLRGPIAVILGLVIVAIEFIAGNGPAHSSATIVWQRIGLSGATIHSVAPGHWHTRLLFAGAEGGVYKRSVDGQWRQVLASGSTWSVQLLSDDRTVLAGDQSGYVHVSSDRGAHWRQRLVNSGGVFAVSAQPGSTRTIIAGAAAGMYLSRDGGAHWSRTLTLHQSAGAAIAWLPGSRQIVYAGAVAGDVHGETSVYVSRDAGISWHVFGHGLGSGGGIMSLAVSVLGGVYAGTMGHATWLASRQTGTWRQIAQGMPVVEDHVSGMTFVPGHPTKLFVGTLARGVFESADGGSHWTSISAGLPAVQNDQIVLSLAYSATDHALYAGTLDGVYRLAQR